MNRQSTNRQGEAGDSVQSSGRNKNDDGCTKCFSYLDTSWENRIYVRWAQKSRYLPSRVLYLRARRECRYARVADILILTGLYTNRGERLTGCVARQHRNILVFPSWIAVRP